MKRWQVIALGLLVSVPVIVYAVAGSWALWQVGALRYVGWVIPVAWSVAFLLARQWRESAAAAVQESVAEHWTARDEAAWTLVQARAQAPPEVALERFLDPHFYLNSAQELGLQITRHYHGDAADPLGPLTVPEVLSAAELALHDTGEWMRQFVPGSHLLRIDHWRMLAKAPGWAKLASRAWRIGSIVIDPTSLVRQLAASLTVDSASRELQHGILAAFYSVFLQRTGYYLIELNSGRLRTGADAYRHRKNRFLAAEKAGDKQRHQAPSPGTDPQGSKAGGQPSAQESDAVVICLVGQVNAGKSSLVNALLGQRRAATDVLPTTRDIKRYRLVLPDATTPLTLLDTPGYGEEGASPQDVEEITAALDGSDAMLLVFNGCHSARRADLQLLEMLAAHGAKCPERKTPPVIGVMTHIDGLRPVLEWEPPYDWQHPSRPKEKTIREALEFNHSQLGPQLTALVPACTDVERGRVHGVQEWVLPAILACLPRARACALLRTLHGDWDESRISLMVDQVKQVGVALWQLIRDSKQSGK